MAGTRAAPWSGPPCRRLLADIEAGRIDVVVVYKVDRLTRALSDFAKLVEVFDRRGVSFVSITQQFNTTTSMGRLTLNILLSFAQFERELIGERVRDKIAASKKKGMWMGGTVPLGYDVERPQARRQRGRGSDRRRHLTGAISGSSRSGRCRKSSTLPASGASAASGPMARNTATSGSRQGALYLLLQNRTYRGEATHKGNAYPGEHAAIVDKPLWDAVQAVSPRTASNGRPAPTPRRQAC